MMEVKENIMDKVTFKLAVVVRTTDHKKISAGRCGRVWWGAGDSWLYRELLDCCWHKQQAVLLHTDREHQAFQQVSECTARSMVLECFQNGQ